MQRLNVAPQHPHAKRVEGSNHGLRSARPPTSFSTRAAISAEALLVNGDGEDGIGRHAQVLDQMRDAVCDHARLATARAGKDQHRPVDGLHRLALLRIQLF